MAAQYKRHWFLVVWLVLIALGGLTSAFVDFFWQAEVKSYAPSLPVWVIYGMGLLGLCNIIFAVALFYFKKWGFWGYCGVSLVQLVVSLYYTPSNPFLNILVTVIAILILYWALNIGKENKAWPRLK